MNCITVSGRLGADAKLKKAGEQDVAEFSLADERFVKGESTTQWFRVTVWGKGANFASTLTKGDAVTVAGALSHRTYEKDGQTRVSLEISAHAFERANKGSGGGASKGKAKADESADDDLIPF